MPVNLNKPGITVCEQLSGIHLCIHMNCYGHRISEERFATQVSNKSQQHPIDKLSEQDITRKTQAWFFANAKNGPLLLYASRSPVTD